MEESPALQSPESVVCGNCKSTVATSVKFCPSCSYPVSGTDEEKSAFRSTVSSRRQMLARAEKKIKTAKIYIYVLAALVFVSGLVYGFAKDDFVLMIVNLCISLLYLIMAAWSDKNPFGAILTTFIIYITLILLNAFLDPSSLFSGWLIKILVIGAFVKAIQSAKEAQGLLADLEKTKSLPG